MSPILRLCDEYCLRMKLPSLRLRHASRFYLFFDDGRRLLSSKFINSDGSTGHYEFRRCILGSKVVVEKKEDVEWDRFESFLEDWLLQNSGFVFDESKVFDLVWRFFVVRNDRFLAANYDPLLIHSSLDPLNSARGSAAMEIINEISLNDCDAARFWKLKASEILSRYGYWLS